MQGPSVLILVLWALSMPILGAEEVVVPGSNLHATASDGRLRLDLVERTGHGHFWWPRTLLHYRVACTAEAVPVERWRLREADSGEERPLQVSQVQRDHGRIARATVSFFADLPTGGRRSFILETAGTTAAAAATADGISEDGPALVLSTGHMRVRLPAAATFPAGATVPGPISAVDDGHGWVGSSRIEVPAAVSRAVRSLRREILERGPLFSRVRLTYDLDGGAGYEATITAVDGYRFVEFAERFTGLDAADGLRCTISWDGLPLTHRRGDEPIDRPHILPYRGEDPHFTGMDQVEDPAQGFYYRLGHAAADNTTFCTATDFSDRVSGRAIALCVLDGARWDDGGYPIWAASASQCVTFRHAAGTLWWQLPLAGRSRHLAIAAYDRNDPQLAAELSRFASGEDQRVAIANKGVADSRDLIGLINSRYGGMGLDVVKEWDLTYPATARRSPPADLAAEGPQARNAATSAAWLKALWGDNELLRVEGNWYSPVSMRVLHQWVVPGFLRFRDSLPPEERQRAEALLLFQAHLAAREEISPIRHMLRGHPNFMADWKYALMAGAYLFPAHPLAGEWADQFEKMVELSSIYHVRPAVPAWQAEGGRWTESIATYNWAFLGPVLKANRLGMLFDGRDRVANPGMALHARYLCGIASAPVQLAGEPPAGSALLPEAGFQRIHPPQGAHSGRRHIPGLVAELAQSLDGFDPLAAEHLRWLDRRPAGGGTGAEGGAGRPSPGVFTAGTNPRLASAKYTGYGVVLRAAVDTPQEIAVFLQQVDKGPNYRWGFGNENGGGDIYYYAAGSSYAGHFAEDAGDRRVSDAEWTCNTGVFKDSTFRGIGMNDLTAPLLDLGGAQFAEILARPGTDAYSWPEYEARSVLLAGHDYIVIGDTLNGVSRLAWSVVRGEDRMPLILPLRGEQPYRTTATAVDAHGAVCESLRLEPYKSGGDRLTLVSHRRDLTQGRSTAGMVEVVRPDGKDVLLQRRTSFRFEEDGLVFSGSRGFVRRFDDGRVELYLLRGERLGTAALQLSVSDPGLAVSARWRDAQEIEGSYVASQAGRLTLGCPTVGTCAVDGRPVAVSGRPGAWEVPLPAGTGRWQCTAGTVRPPAVAIRGTVATADGAIVRYDPVPCATGYRLEVSRDGGTTWGAAATASGDSAVVGGLPAGTAQVRVVALNGGIEGPPGREHPLRITGVPPPPPVGLRLRLARDAVTVRWGRVLGAAGYVLYRSPHGSGAWQAVYRGPDTSYIDAVPGMVAASTEPGLAARAASAAAPVPVHDYAVSAVDGIGEGTRSVAATSDPFSWRNWYPSDALVFKRRTAYWLPPFVHPGQVPPEAYPGP